MRSAPPGACYELVEPGEIIGPDGCADELEALAVHAFEYAPLAPLTAPTVDARARLSSHRHDQATRRAAIIVLAWLIARRMSTGIAVMFAR